MENNKENDEKNQSQNPQFETIPIEEIPPNIEESAVEGSQSPQLEQIPSPIGLENEAAVSYPEGKLKYLLFFGFIIIFFIFLFLIFRFFFSGKKSNSSITLTYWGLWEEEQVFKPLIEDYKKQNPYVVINYQKMSPENYREKLIARSKNGQGPDIFRFHNTWLPEIKEVASPLPSSIMSNQEFEKTFYKIHQKDLKVGNYYYGLPLEIDGLVLVYNNNLFKKAGIANEPVTWEDIAMIVPRLTVKDRNGQLITSGIAIGTASNLEHFSDIFGLLLLQNGGKLAELDQPEAVGALEAFRKFAEKPDNFWDESMPNSITAFIQEKVAMILVPSWQVLVIKAANPEIDLRVTQVPFVPGGKPISIANYWVEGVNKYSPHQLEGWKFLRFLVEKDNLTKLYEIQSKIRLFGEPYSRVDLAPLLSQNPYLAAVIKQADNFVSLPLVARTVDNGLNDGIISYIGNAINATISGVSYGEALRTAKQGIDQILNQYNL